MNPSIVIRSYNEEAHIAKLIAGIRQQTIRPHEIILVDSGSTDRTVDIARSLSVTIVSIDKSEFTFGLALNRGCAAATGDILVFVSAHVYPEGRRWLENLLAPFENKAIALSYGRQNGGEINKFSERRLMCKWFPRVSMVPQDSDFCNNANCAIRADLWRQYRYDETLTGLEDLDWARRVRADGWQIAYRADAAIVHVHEESWTQVRNRYRREATAMKQIDRNCRLSLIDAIRLYPEHVLRDIYAAMREGLPLRRYPEIVLFRFHQLFGTWQGFSDSPEVSQKLKRRFYYPPRAIDPKKIEPVHDERIDYRRSPREPF